MAAGGGFPFGVGLSRWGHQPLEHPQRPSDTCNSFVPTPHPCRHHVLPITTGCFVAEFESVLEAVSTRGIARNKIPIVGLLFHLILELPVFFCCCCTFREPRYQYPSTHSVQIIPTSSVLVRAPKASPPISGHNEPCRAASGSLKSRLLVRGLAHRPRGPPQQVSRRDQLPVG